MTQALPTGRYRVRVWYDERDEGHTFGAFTNRDKAADCLQTLAARLDVKEALIEQVEDE